MCTEAHLPTCFVSIQYFTSNYTLLVTLAEAELLLYHSHATLACYYYFLSTVLHFFELAHKPKYVVQRKMMQTVLHLLTMRVMDAVVEKKIYQNYLYIQVQKQFIFIMKLSTLTSIPEVNKKMRKSLVRMSYNGNY